jgi:hypothetical protein
MLYINQLNCNKSTINNEVNDGTGSDIWDANEVVNIGNVEAGNGTG